MAGAGLEPGRLLLVLALATGCAPGLWVSAGGCCLPEDPLVLVCVLFAGHGVHVGCLVDV